jgi:hypothetical protein
VGGREGVGEGSLVGRGVGLLEGRRVGMREGVAVGRGVGVVEGEREGITLGNCRGKGGGGDGLSWPATGCGEASECGTESCEWPCESWCEGPSTLTTLGRTVGPWLGSCQTKQRGGGVTDDQTIITIIIIIIISSSSSSSSSIVPLSETESLTLVGAMVGAPMVGAWERGDAGGGSGSALQSTQSSRSILQNLRNRPVVPTLSVPCHLGWYAGAAAGAGLGYERQVFRDSQYRNHE